MSNDNPIILNNPVPPDNNLNKEHAKEFVLKEKINHYAGQSFATDNANIVFPDDLIKPSPVKKRNDKN
ncbi:hypothetical protein ACWOAH_11050 [Vagococcus vulneris]|uniref:Uncharacterized protein n=1 Tax=Vagococcus vulneris TaxID=1977869 RepID=A0A429ZS60_9ENTE|nr:hypothetical protein [Vagococcus vulneris]RST96556.1 hypothetical protein CBF37_10930 [Vagococcus vulneris]